MSTGKIVVGVGGWTYEPWRGVFYPKGLAQKDELSHASSRLTSIEINGTFYGSQKPASFQKWFDETPDDFVFALKGPRFATNRRVLAEAGESIGRFVDSGIRNLKHKLGPINWQFASTKKFDAVDFEEFLKLLPTEFKHALEVRHESFKCAEFVDLARRYQVAIVVAGDSEHPHIADVTAPFVYVRIMGSTEEANGYADPHLDQWAICAKAFASGNQPDVLPAAFSPLTDSKQRDVFLYVIGGFKQSNPAVAMALIERISA